MTTDDFPDVALVFRQSLIARATLNAVDVLRASATRSFAAGVMERVRCRLAEVSTPERVRLAGALLLAATVTQGLLLQIVPGLVRPAAPRLLRVEMVIAAVVLILAAPQLARAWQGSRVRQFLALFKAATQDPPVR